MIHLPVLAVLIHLAGALAAVGVFQDAWALMSDRVTATRRPLLIYRGAVKTMLLIIYTNYVATEFWGSIFPRGLTAFGTALVFFLIGLEWVVTWHVDRSEYYQLLKGEAVRALEKVEELGAAEGEEPEPQGSS